MTNLPRAETTNLTRKKEDRLKEILCDSLILNLYEVSAETELHTDVSWIRRDTFSEKQIRQRDASNLSLQ
jgi:hypothetical protein